MIVEMGVKQRRVSVVFILYSSNEGPKSEALLGFDSEALVCTMIGIF